jgi:hypothetical protein
VGDFNKIEFELLLKFFLFGERKRIDHQFEGESENIKRNKYKCY